MKQENEGIQTYGTVSPKPKGTGPDSAGQSGDTQGVNDTDVEELLEEGQTFEAEVMESVDDAPDADVAEVHTRQVRDDDVPDEYLEKD